MVDVDQKTLLSRLNQFCQTGLATAVGNCVSRTNYEVTVGHLFQALIQEPTADIQVVLKHYGIDHAQMQKALTQALDRYRSGNSGKPVFSPMLFDWIQAGWVLASLEHGLAQIRSGMLLRALLANPSRYTGDDWADIMQSVTRAELKDQFDKIVIGSGETAQVMSGTDAAAGVEPGRAGVSSRSADSALAKFCIDFTERARQGMIDPVFGREREIRQMVDILARRRKNNPICVGEPGTGKTAVVEGLALRVIEGQVPDSLKGVDIIGLDLGMLQAGASVKGEFEKRLKGVLDEVKSSIKPIILFIDEAHALIGAGGAAGTGDAGQLLKPALARGEMKTIAATTWSEYKKYFEKDAALARRFQLVKLDEPNDSTATTMLRGLRDQYEKSHGVLIRDEAIIACAEMGSRYIAGRFHPDKGIDLMDTSAARVRVAMAAKPPVLQDKETMVQTLERELHALQRDDASGGNVDRERMGEVQEELKTLAGEIATLTERWKNEKAAADKALAARRTMLGDQDPIVKAQKEAERKGKKKAAAGNGSAKPAAGEKPAEGDAPAVDAAAGAPEPAKMSPEEAKGAYQAALDELRQLQGDDPLIFVEVNKDVVARVVADWTGVPVGNMVKDEASTLLAFEKEMTHRIKGQDHAAQMIGTAMRAAKSGIKNPATPMGVFLLVGPSGTGKTETALTIADMMFGGEHFMTTINMSEFQEKHTVSRLIGSPPGYVGYGEGGVLTEAVRQRPYSVVLLDECEKADPEVLNLFYQVFDKGSLSDGEGREVDFKDTVLFLTSNLATDIITTAGLGDKNFERLHGQLAGVIANPGDGAKKTELGAELSGMAGRLQESDFTTRLATTGALLAEVGATPRDFTAEESAQLNDLLAQFDELAKPAEMDDLMSMIRPALSKHFKPALLARMTVIPFYPIGPDAMKMITRLKLGKLKERLWESHRMAMDVAEDVVDAIADRCTEVETGARNVDHILSGTLLPEISRELLEQMSQGPLPDKLSVGFKEGEFTYAFSGK